MHHVRWSIIAAQLPGRTDNDIKNHWNTKLKKKLMGFIQSSPNNQRIKSPNSLFPPTSTLQTTFQPQSQASISSLFRDSYVEPIPLIQPNFMYNNNNIMNFQLGITNNQYSSNFHDQSLMNPMQAVSCCSPSDGVSYNQISYGNEETMCQIPFEETQKFTLDNYCSSWADHDQKPNGSFGNNFQSCQFQYDTNIEEVKELISSSSSNGNGCNNVGYGVNFNFNSYEYL